MHWVQERPCHPLLAPVTVLADFFNDIALACDVVPSTLDAIKSCILLTIKLCTGVDHTNNYELYAICARYHKECPAEVFTYPDWNLVLVLEILRSSHFEPLHEISMKMLTYKTVLLVAIACSCRVSELHALAFDKLSHTKDWSIVYLEAKSDFLAKNQSIRKDSRKFALKALVKPVHKTSFPPNSSEAAQYHRNKLLCPVRALRVYLARTAYRRRNKHALFISLNANHKSDITKQSICNWVRKTIYLCYQLAGENDQNLGRASVHEIRSVTSSIKFERSMSLDSVLKTCMWKHNNTFTRYYLRDVAVLSDNLYRMPPLWMAQSVING